MNTEPTPLFDECIAGYRCNGRPPFAEAYLTITLCSVGSRVPDTLTAWLDEAKVEEEMINDRKVLELLRLVVAQVECDVRRAERNAASTANIPW